MNQVNAKSTGRVVAGRILLALAALAALRNALYMLVDPTGWYWSIPTVPATGPFNPHFVRDIGLAFLVSGALLALAAWRHRQAMTWAPVGIAWLAAHGALHVWETAVGICSPDRFATDAPSVIGLPVVALIGLAMLRWPSATVPQAAA